MLIRFELVKDLYVKETFIVDCYDWDEVQGEIDAAKYLKDFDECVCTKIEQLSKDDFFKELNK